MGQSRLLTVFRKEMREIRNTKMFLVFLVGPLVIAVFVIRDLLFTLPPSELVAESQLLVPLFALLFPVGIAGMLSIESFLGERNNRTIEPLLASPVSERELFVAKALAAFLPAMAITFILVFGTSAALAVALPRTLAIVLSGASLVRVVWQAPVLALFVTCLVTIVSSRVSDTRVALNLVNYFVLAIVFIFGFGEIQFLGNSFMTLVIITLALSVVDVILLLLSNRFFTREGLLSRT